MPIGSPDRGLVRAHPSTPRQVSVLASLTCRPSRTARSACALADRAETPNRARLRCGRPGRGYLGPGFTVERFRSASSGGSRRAISSSTPGTGLVLLIGRTSISTLARKPDSDDAIAMLLVLAGAEICWPIHETYGLPVDRIPDTIAGTVQLVVDDLKSKARGAR